MATTIRELLTKIGIEADSAELDLLDKKISTFKSNLKGVATVAGAAFAAVSAALVTSAAAGNRAAKAADRVGVLVERYQELKFAAGQADVEQEKLEAALRFANVQLGESERGSKGAIERFKGLGIATRDAAGKLKTADQILLDVARSLEGETDQALISAKAARVFGEEAGPKLVPLLRQGERGVRALMLTARDLGEVMGEEQARQSEFFFDRLDDLRAVAAGLRNEFARGLLPQVNRFLVWMIDVQKRGRELNGARLEAWGERLGDALSKVRKIGEHVLTFLSDAKEGASAVDVLAGSVIALGVAMSGATMVAGVGVLRQLFKLIAKQGRDAILKWVAANALLLVQVLLFVGVFVAAGLAVDDFLTFIRGGDSVIGRFLESIGMADDARATLIAFGKEARASIQPLLDVLADLFDLEGTTWTEAWLTGVRELVPLITSFVDSTLTGIREITALMARWRGASAKQRERGLAGEAAAAEREAGAGDAAAVRAALERRARREGVSLEQLLVRRAAEGQAGADEVALNRGLGAQIAAHRERAGAVDRSRVVNMGPSSVTFSNVQPADQEGIARRVIAEQARQVRANLVEGADL